MLGFKNILHTFFTDQRKFVAMHWQNVNTFIDKKCGINGCTETRSIFNEKCSKILFLLKNIKVKKIQLAILFN